MRYTGLKERFRQRELTVGSWLSFQFLPLTEMLARKEFDWLVIDIEHTSIDLHEVMDMVMLIEQAGVSPLVRVGANDSLIIKRVMDMGAHGVLVPDVRSADEAQQVVDSLYYPPLGKRGAGLARAQAYGMDFQGYTHWLESEAVIVVQIEHVDAVRDLQSILAVDGVDGFILGPYDLSASVGRPGQFEDPEVEAILAEVAAAVHVAQKPAGIHIVHPDLDILRARIAEGYRIIAYGDDMVFFSDAVDRVAAHVKECRG